MSCEYGYVVAYTTAVATSALQDKEKVAAFAVLLDSAGVKREDGYYHETFDSYEQLEEAYGIWFPGDSWSGSVVFPALYVGSVEHSDNAAEESYDLTSVLDVYEERPELKKLMDDVAELFDAPKPSFKLVRRVW